MALKAQESKRGSDYPCSNLFNKPSVEKRIFRYILLHTFTIASNGLSSFNLESRLIPNSLRIRLFVKRH